MSEPEYATVKDRMDAIFRERERYRSLQQAKAQRPSECGRCGAPSSYLRWDIADGWCCTKCGGCDSDE